MCSMVPRQDADPGTETTRVGEIEAEQSHQPDQGTIVKGSRDNITVKLKLQCAGTSDTTEKG